MARERPHPLPVSTLHASSSAGNKRNNLRLSPDGKAVAYTRLNGDTQDVWTHDFSRGVPARITLNGGRSPVWSPDGTQIAYLRGDTIFRKPVAGGAEVAVWKGAGILALNDWSGDNRHLLLTRWDASEGMNGRGLWLLSLEAGSAGKEPALLEARALHGMFAPANGAARWIAFDRGGQTFVRTMPGEEMGLWQVSVDGGNGVRWRRDGRELFFLAGRSLMAMAVSEGPTFHAGSLRELFVAPPSIRTAVSQYALGYDVAADGQRFLATSPTTEAPGTAIHIEINWQSGLRK